jgi:hypothetical protein
MKAEPRGYPHLPRPSEATAVGVAPDMNHIAKEVKVHRGA